MANEDRNQYLPERDKDNKGSPTSGEERSFPERYGNSSRNTAPFSDPASEWQRTGHSSDQSWWESGTDQQQHTYGGDTNYPYRENYWGRNQQGREGIKNYYPQEPASARQRRNFAEGSQYPYEGGYGAENPQAREGLERASEWKGSEQGSGQSRQYNNPDQVRSQNLNMMESDERGYRGDYGNRDREYERSRNRAGDHNYGYESGRGGQRYDRINEPGGVNRQRDFGGYDRRHDDNRNRYDRRGRNYQEQGYDRYEGGRGQYHSTETDNPGQGYDSEREMYRNANRGGFDRSDRNYGRSNYRGERGNNPPFGDRVASSHRATGPYEDFERDRERYGVGVDYRERDQSYDRADRGHERTRDFNYRPGEEAERRRRSNQFRARSWERSPRGNRGPGDSDYRSRYEDDRGRY